MRSTNWAAAALIMTMAGQDLIAGPGSGAGLPAARHLEVAPVYQPVVDTLWRSSPTFRQQWRRLAASRNLRVEVLAEPKPTMMLAAARSQIVRRPGEPVTASVYLPPSRDIASLLAHELEHVLEQLDGVNLAEHVRTGVVRAGGHTGFETLRAIEAGRRVAHELGTSSSTSSTGATLGDGPVRLAQGETTASPASARASRVSAGGRYIVFVSAAPLVAADRDTRRDVYVFDRLSGRYTRESGAPDGPGDGESRTADISGDGRYVVFESEASNLMSPAFAPGESHIYLRDRATGTIRLLTTDATGRPARGSSRNPVISADGSTVAFESAAVDLIAAHDGTTRPAGIFAIRLTDGQRFRVDVAGAEERPCGRSMTPSISGDGNRIAFASRGCAAGTADADGTRVYVRDLVTGATTWIGRGGTGSEPDGASFDPAISGDGGFVAFVSAATNLAGVARSRGQQIFVHDMATGTVALVSRTPDGRPADGPSMRPAITADGRVVAFESVASDLECGRRCDPAQRDINLVSDVFVHDRATGLTRRVTTGAGWTAGGRSPALDAAGDVVALVSTQLVDDADDAYDEDLFVMAGVRGGGQAVQLTQDWRCRHTPGRAPVPGVQLGPLVCHP